MKKLQLYIGINNLLRANLVATNGPAALDLSELSPDMDVQVSGALVSFGEGSLTVQGRDTLLFGEQKDPTTFNYPLLDAPNLAFETTGGAGLVLTNLVALRNAPAGFTVADGALLALRGALTGAGTVHADSIRTTQASGTNGSRLANVAGFSGDFVLGVNATFNPDISNCVLRLAGFGDSYHIPSITYDYPMLTLVFESATRAACSTSAAARCC